MLVVFTIRSPKESSRAEICSSCSLPHATGLVVLEEPLDGDVHRLVEGGELEVGEVLPELLVVGRLLELPVRLGGVEGDLQGGTSDVGVEGLGHGVRNVGDGHLVLLADGEDDRVRLVVGPERPDHELRQVDGEDELAKGLAAAPDVEGFALLLAVETTVDETGDDVGVLQVEVVVLAEDVGGDDGGVVAPVLGLVHAVLDVDHALGVGVALVGEVRGTVVDHGLVDREGGFIGEDAGGEAGHQLLHAALVALLEDVVVHVHVVPPELHLVLHVGEETAHLGREVDDVGGLVLVEDGSHGGGVAEVTVLRGKERRRSAREFRFFRRRDASQRVGSGTDSKVTREVMGAGHPA